MDKANNREFSMMDYRKTFENEARVMVLETQTKAILKSLDKIENNHLKHLQDDINLIKDWIARNTPQSKLISKVFEYIAFLIVAALIALIVKG